MVRDDCNTSGNCGDCCTVIIGGRYDDCAANKKVKQVIAWQGKAKERRKSKVFLTEGIKMFEEAQEGQILEVYVSQEQEEKLKQLPFIWKKLKQTGYEIVTAEVFGKMSDTKTPQGILTVLKQPSYDLEALLEDPNPVFLVLEDIQDPGNLGTMIRTGEGAGITGVLMTRETVDIFNPKTIRATMGSIYRVPFVYVDSCEETILQLQKKGICVYAAHLDGKAYYDGMDLRKPTAFLIGNEGNGLKKSTADLADNYLKIPMEGKVESLNAAIAATLLMYEAHRQRQ